MTAGDLSSYSKHRLRLAQAAAKGVGDVELERAVRAELTRRYMDWERRTGREGSVKRKRRFSQFDTLRRLFDGGAVRARRSKVSRGSSDRWVVENDAGEVLRRAHVWQLYALSGKGLLDVKDDGDGLSFSLNAAGRLALARGFIPARFDEQVAREAGLSLEEVKRAMGAR